MIGKGPGVPPDRSFEAPLHQLPHDRFEFHWFLSSAAQRRAASCCVSVIRSVSSPVITKAGSPGAAPRTVPPPPTKKAIWKPRRPDRAFVRLSACMAPPLPPPHHNTGILLPASCRIKQEASPHRQSA